MTEAADRNDKPVADTREATVRVPKVALPNVLRVLEAAQKYGSNPTLSQVGAELDQSLRSGAFRNRMAAANIFGLVEPERGRIRITQLGRQLLDPDTRRGAAVTAFLNVEVFSAVYHQYEGGRLPPDSGLEAELKAKGVTDPPTTRRVLQTSAEFAGFFHLGRDRLVRPPLDEPVSLASWDEQSSSAGTQDRQRLPQLHPLVEGLLQQLPEPGGVMSSRQLKRWLDAARVNLELVYLREDDEGESC